MIRHQRIQRGKHGVFRQVHWQPNWRLFVVALEGYQLLQVVRITVKEYQKHKTNQWLVVSHGYILYPLLFNTCGKLFNNNIES